MWEISSGRLTLRKEEKMKIQDSRSARLVETSARERHVKKTTEKHTGRFSASVQAPRSGLTKREKVFLPPSLHSASSEQTQAHS